MNQPLAFNKPSVAFDLTNVACSCQCLKKKSQMVASWIAIVIVNDCEEFEKVCVNTKTQPHSHQISHPMMLSPGKFQG